MTKTIIINNKEYVIKQTIRAIFLWEEITRRTFEIKNTMDNYIYFYCILLANNPDFMLWDEFIDYLDNNPDVLVDLGKKLAECQELEKLLNPDDEVVDGDKKKE